MVKGRTAEDYKKLPGPAIRRHPTDHSGRRHAGDRPDPIEEPPIERGRLRRDALEVSGNYREVLLPLEQDLAGQEAVRVEARMCREIDDKTLDQNPCARDQYRRERHLRDHQKRSAPRPRLACSRPTALQ